MIYKIIFIALVLFLIYLIFFKKSRKKDQNLISDEMVECPTCSTFVSSKEAILSNGKFYCSKECLNKRG